MTGPRPAPRSFFAEACAITSTPLARLNPTWTPAVGDLGLLGEFLDRRRGSAPSVTTAPPRKPLPSSDQLEPA